MTNIGDVVFLDYGEHPPCVHSRLVLAAVDPANHWYVILTPDFDIYAEQLDGSNGDLAAYHPAPPGGGLPPGVPPGRIYGFAPMSAAQYSQHMAAGRLEAAAEMGRRGIVPAAAGPVAPPSDEVWVLCSLVEGRKLGEVVTPPAGMATLGAHGIMEVANGAGQNTACLVMKVGRDDVAGLCENLVGLCRVAEAVEGDDKYVAEDIRTMSVKYSANGDRLRTFRDSVGEMVSTELEDFPFEPRTCMEYLRAIQSVSESCHAQHLAWVAQSRVPDGSRAIYEDETLAQILDTAITYDALNVSNLAAFELLVRRRQLIASAHSHNASAPSYDGADYYLGNRYRQGGAIVVPALTDHVSKKLQADSAILKERRKLAEAKAGAKGASKGPAKGSGAQGQGA